MKKFTIDEYDYTVNIKDGTIKITAVNFNILRKYSGLFSQSYLSQHTTIDKIEALYEFILDCFEKNPHEFKYIYRDSEIVLVGEIGTKYRTEKYVFTLIKENSNYKDILHMRITYLSNELKKIKQELKSTQLLTMKMIKTNYVELPNGTLIPGKYGPHRIQFYQQNEKDKIVYNFGIPNFPVCSSDDVKFIIEQLDEITEIRIDGKIEIDPLIKSISGKDIKCYVLIINSDTVINDMKLFETIKCENLVVLNFSSINPILWSKIFDIENIKQIRTSHIITNLTLIKETPINNLQQHPWNAQYRYK